ncbi:putative serine/threonine-protein kinase [Psilocybe cubensis]|uniref:Serine/threonine-protein kinase n=2 Tax=Psilocybe cubensis TaxID=181762 RepID=A0ACB8HHK3_PSICU|nr:putative serine/threonine-protein kinase [Psilocybe cubensis]KAH9486941.1 putative serine/threonine-protein kinase [Psilocybe cubensis]
MRVESGWTADNSISCLLFFARKTPPPLPRLSFYVRLIFLLPAPLAKCKVCRFSSSSTPSSPAPDGHPQHIPNGHPTQPQHLPPPPPLPQPTQHRPQLKAPITVVGIPSVSVQDNRLVVGSSQSRSTRSYTPLKVLGDGSFGTVWLCDWHGTLPPNTPLSPMQCGAGARPDWAGKRLVAVKLMKKRWEGGWDECQKLKELESLRAIPFHPNVIPLYDFFLLPDTKELYFVFESMEGNLYHLIKARKGRPLAGGLVSSIFHQIVLGLDHIHTHGYFHRDMKPENVLVTTTGLFDYTSLSPIAPPNAPKEKDVVAIIKLADFGLARETKSKPPYTEYVSTRWYRAPEVLLLSRDYSNPVDMWAFGTIMAELVNLRPLFPGSDQVDQVARICEILGDPSDAYGVDMFGSRIGGGPWAKGNKLANEIGFQFPKVEPKDFYALFAETVPRSLIDCIRDLLRYDPDKRLTSRQCLEHRYLFETIPRNHITLPFAIQGSVSNTSIPNISTYVNGTHSQPSLPTLSPQHPPLPPHSHSSQNLHQPQPIIDPSTTHRIPYPIPPAPQPQFPILPNPPIVVAHNDYRHPPNGWPASQADYPMDVSTQEPPNPHQHINGHTHEAQDSAMLQDHTSPPAPQPQHASSVQSQHGNKFGKFVSLKKNSKWGLSMFVGDKSHHNTLPPVDETSPAIIFPSRKRAQSSSTDSKSLRESSPVREQPVDQRNSKKVQNMNKKEAERLHREAEMAKRELARMNAREQARSVLIKRQQMVHHNNLTDDLEWVGGPDQRLELKDSKGKQPSSGPVRQQVTNGNAAPSSTLGAAAGKFVMQQNDPLLSPLDRDRDREWRGSQERERFAKARRREFDDDHSMSSSDMHSVSRMSSISFATVDSDPGPSSRLRNRPSLYNISRMTSRSSLRTSFDDFPPSARSSNSFSLEGQLAHDFRTQASVSSHLSGSVSPPPIQLLSLSPTMSPPLSPSPAWVQIQQHKEGLLSRTQSPPFVAVSPRYYTNPSAPHSPLDLHSQLPPLPASPYGHPPSSYGGYPPSSGHTPKSAKSAINPIFKVPPLPPPPLPPLTGDDRLKPLPPFSQLDAVAGGEYPPLSPIVFTTPEEV